MTSSAHVVDLKGNTFEQIIYRTSYVVIALIFSEKKKTENSRVCMNRVNSNKSMQESTLRKHGNIRN